MTSRMINREAIREEGVNVPLNQLLRGHGLPAKAERRRRNAAPDIQVTLKTGDLALLECKWDESRAALEGFRLIFIVGLISPHRHSPFSA